MKNLEAGEVSAVYRVRSTAEVAAWWQALNAEERGQLLAQLYIADAPRRGRQAVAERRAAARRLWDSGQFRTRGDLARHLGISQATLSEEIGRRVEGRKTRVGEDSAIRDIVRDLLKRDAWSLKEVIRLAREAGDDRSERKIEYRAQRFRQEQELEGDTPQAAPVPATGQVTRKQFRAAQNRRRTAEEGQQGPAQDRKPQAATEGQDEAKKRLGVALRARRPKK